MLQRTFCWGELYVPKATSMPAEYVGPFVNSNKNDYIDAEAEQRPAMRFVPIKNGAQLEMQALPGAGSLDGPANCCDQPKQGLLARAWDSRTDGVPSEVSALVYSRDGTNVLSTRMRALLAEIRFERMKLEEQIDTIYRELAQFATMEESCRRLLTVPGIGPLTATTLIVAIAKAIARLS